MIDRYIGILTKSVEPFWTEIAKGGHDRNYIEIGIYKSCKFDQQTLEERTYHWTLGSPVPRGTCGAPTSQSDHNCQKSMIIANPTTMHNAVNTWHIRLLSLAPKRVSGLLRMRHTGENVLGYEESRRRVIRSHLRERWADDVR